MSLWPFILLKTYNNNLPFSKQCLCTAMRDLAILSESEHILLYLGILLLKVFNSMYGVSEKNLERKKEKRGTCKLAKN